MHKAIKLSTVLMFGALVATACGTGPSTPGGKTGTTGGGSTSRPWSTEHINMPEEGKLEMWHNFGANYTTILEEAFVTPLLADKIDVYAESKGSYEGILEKMNYASAEKTYPNIVTGYPDHFATYSRWGYPASETGALANLNKYLDNKELNEKHKQETGYYLREDYYPEYMVENDSICYALNNADDAITVGLPFNKSTEVIGYNGIFFDYVEEQEAKAGRTIKVPDTWDEWKTYGPVFRRYQMQLNGKYLYGDLSTDGDMKGSNFVVETSKRKDSEGRDIKPLLDFSLAKDSETAVLSWDSLENMFITLVRQFGSQFTSYTREDRTARKTADRHGYMEFYSGDNKAKTVAAMQLVRDLSGTNDATRIFATPKFVGGSYASAAFADNKVLFTICSTGGLSYNINEGQRFRVHTVPYQSADNKYVISQGANMTILRQDNKRDPSMSRADTEALAFEALVKMTTGDYQAEWAKNTGYYPASKSATESQIYQDFLASTEALNDPVERAYREGAQLNNEHYMKSSENWIKFVDPGFPGSADIRRKTASIIEGVINNSSKSIDTILQEIYNDADLVKFVRK